MEALHWRQRNTAADAGRVAGLHAASGGARERWSLVLRPPARAMFCGGARDWLADNGARKIFAGGGGTAAINIRQPMQQSSMQCLLLVSPEAGTSSPATSVWQMMPFGAAAAAAAALAAPKLVIRLAVAIA